MKRFRLILIVLATSCLWISALEAATLSDVGKEQRWATQVTDTLFDGEAVWLDAGGHQFLGIDMPPTDGDTGRAAVVVHGIGVHPNWDQVIRPLRVGLAENGWHTLSIQMPVLPNDAEPMAYAPLFDEVTSRFNAAIEYLQSKGQDSLVVVAHSMGSSMTMRYLADSPETPLMGAVLIGMNGRTDNSAYNRIDAFKKVKIPLLDLYGSDDLPDVVQYAERKADAAAAAGIKDFSQVVVPGANHFFDGKEEQLLETVSKWLEGLAAP